MRIQFYARIAQKVIYNCPMLNQFREKLLRPESAYLVGMVVAMGEAIQIWEHPSLELNIRIFGAIVLALAAIACAVTWVVDDAEP